MRLSAPIKWIVITSIFILPGIIGCEKELHPARQTKLKMGTYVSISIYDQKIPPKKLNETMEKAFNAIDFVESLTSRQDSSSELYHVNKMAGKGWIPIHAQLAQILQASLCIAEDSNGAFDPTIAPLLELWQFDSEKPHLPNPTQIQSVLADVGYNQIQLDSARVRLDDPNTHIDLGGIAKGSAVDAAAQQLLQSGIKDFMVDAGGDLALHSSKLTKGKIRIWIRHPRKRESLFAYFYQDSGSVATSGDYEQYFEENHKRYHHILNPKTGYPDSDVISVTVTAKTTELADACATAIFVLGWKNGIEFAVQHPQLGVVILQQKNDKIQFWASKNMMNKIHVTDDTL